MQQVLKVSTAATTIVGPILDSTGAIYTGAAIGDLNITKNGTTAAMAAAATLTHDHNGHYILVFTTGNTDTLGRLDITCNKSSYAMPPKVFEVLSATAFDAIVTNGTIASTTSGRTIVVDAAGLADANTVKLGPTGAGTAQTARDLGASVIVASGTVTTLTNAPPDSSGVTTLLSRVTSARAGYLDNLNTSGVVASQADINALNQSASRRVILTTVGQYERPESGSSTYTVEARTYSADGAIVNADSTPTLTATGIVSGSLAANLSAASSPATGVYRWTYTVSSSATLEQVRFDLSATIAAEAWPMAVYSQVADFVAATWTTADRATLEARATQASLDEASDFLVETLQLYARFAVTVNSGLGTNTLVLDNAGGGLDDYPDLVGCLLCDADQHAFATVIGQDAIGAGTRTIVLDKAVSTGGTKFIVPGHHAQLAGSAQAVAIVEANNDKTGYTLSGAGVTAVQSGLATASALSTAQTAVTAIKVKTDQFVFTVANRVDSTTQAGVSTLTAAQVNAEVDTALADIFLHQLFAADYDPANKPGVATALLNELIGSNAGVSRYTAAALALAPTGGGGGGGTTVNEDNVIVVERTSIE